LHILIIFRILDRLLPLLGLGFRPCELRRWSRLIVLQSILQGCIIRFCIQQCIFAEGRWGRARGGIRVICRLIGAGVIIRVRARFRFYKAFNDVKEEKVRVR
jgi:hypothetical protein